AEGGGGAARTGRAALGGGWLVPLSFAEFAMTMRSCFRGLSPRPATPLMRKRLGLETLERRDCPSAGDWVGSGFDPQGSRNNTHENTLGPANVAQMGVAWTFPTPAPVTGTPAVAGGVLYAGDFAGNFYALDADDGKLIWQWHQPFGIPVSDSPLVTKGVVVFGDLGGNVYGLDADTGAQLWAAHPAGPGIQKSAIFGSPTQVGKYVVIGT